MGQQSERALVLARQLHADLVAAFRQAGWPVEAETFPEFAEYRAYPGPARLTVGRWDQLSSLSGDEDPDDPSLDLTRPARVEMTAPLLAVEGVEVSAAVQGDRPAEELVAGLGGVLADGRANAVRAAVDDSACPICSDPYPRAHLVSPTVAGDLAVCPACVFDGDLLPRGLPARLTYQLSRLFGEDLAAPAGWSAVAALLACAARPGLGERLEGKWRHEGGVLDVPAWWWSTPGDIWIWLPPRACRPHVLRHFGPGARLGAVVQAVDAAHPDLRQRVRARQREFWLEASGDEDQTAPDQLVEAVWPAVVAYAVAFTTQAAERLRRRAPLEHVGYSFETFTLKDHLDQLGSSLDVDDVASTLTIGLEMAIGTLDLARTR
jgi:hypothetical protein